ncbi:MAG: acyl-CoA thioesterase domain-containing protein [Candidatus Nanopelagicales bacterium]
MSSDEITQAASQEFLARLHVSAKPDDAGSFTGSCLPAWPGRAFGGQLAAQSLQAAFAANPNPEMKPWSLHMHFLAPTKANEPIDYEVEIVKEGRSLSSRQVFVRQDGKLRATALAMFATTRPGPRHGYRAPMAPSPDSVPAEERLVHPSIVPVDADFTALGYPEESYVDLRISESHPDPETGDGSYERKAWMRVTVPLPDDPLTVASTLCYLSDITLGTTALTPHGGRDGASGLQLGAVELALWFTNPAHVDEWLLFVQDSPFTGLGHGLAYGAFYNSAGDLAGTAIQNALLRDV